MRTALVRRVRALVAVAALAPAALFGQQPAAQPGTYTVKRGDTLWDLARRFLSDPYLWPQIYRLNTDKIRDPHWIYPGEVLTMPQAVAAAPAPERPPVAPPEAPPAEEPQGFNEPTIFAPATHTRRAVNYDAVPLVTPAPAVRQGEYTAAPYIDRLGGPRGSGKIVSSAELQGIASFDDPGQYQKNTRVFIALPPGARADSGTRFVSYVLGPELEQLGQTVIPTGVIRVLKPARPGEATTAEVLDLFREVSQGQNLLPYDSAAAMLKARPVAGTGARVGTVKWVYEEPVLPAPQFYLVLDLSAKDGLKMGDRLQLFRESQPGENPGDLRIPEITVGSAAVVRVTPFAATAVVTAVMEPKIEVGTRARVTARMP